ncbi:MULTISPECIES: OmpW/AlkL family protein [Burkholderia]|uniref:OmpW/AlkL family protein n=1 Tax=Burkholderia TaxID=32008 RepID=UPI002AAF8A39|nr:MULTISPECIES: OmpW family outer membrane protein [Burkholderia]
MKHVSKAVLLMIATTSFANAQSAGQVVVNAGWLHLAPQDSSQPLSIHAFGQASEVPGSGISVGNADTFALTARYYVTDHFALETILGVPPKLHMTGTGTISQLGDLGTARAWSPALQLQYHFGESTSHFRPYLGAGVAYVWYRSIQLSQPVATGQMLYSPTFGTQLEGPTSVTMNKSFAPVLNAGLTYNINARWSLGASVSYMWSTAKATLTTHSPMGVVTTTTKVKINPIVSFVSIGYKF